MVDYKHLKKRNVDMWRKREAGVKLLIILGHDSIYFGDRECKFVSMD